MPPLILLLGTLQMTSPSSSIADNECRNGYAVLLTDFSPTTNALGWYSLNDNVMGGRSEGGFEIKPGHLRFAGRTNTNGGGFSSIRTGPLRLNLSNQSGIRLQVKGDGRRYTWRIASNAAWRGQQIGYWATFDTTPEKWITVDIPFSRFVPRFRGTVLDGPPLDIENITGMGLMIYDKQDGQFEILLRTVASYSKRMPTRLAGYRWKHRVLIINAPTASNEDFIRLKREVAAGAAAFAERDLLLVTLLERGESTAGPDALSQREAGCMRAETHIQPGAFALRLIGKDGGVKLSSDSAVPIDDIYRQIDAMPMRRFEAAERSLLNR